MERAKFRLQAEGLLIGYCPQFLVGMLLSLFIALPNTHPGSSGTEYFTRSSRSLIWAFSGHGGWELAFHAYLALFLVFGSIGLVINAVAAHDKSWTIAASIAALLTIGAFFNGLSFVNYNKNISSMIMATCWLGAVTVLVIGLIRSHDLPQANKHA